MKSYLSGVCQPPLASSSVNRRLSTAARVSTGWQVDGAPCGRNAPLPQDEQDQHGGRDSAGPAPVDLSVDQGMEGDERSKETT